MWLCPCVHAVPKSCSHILKEKEMRLIEFIHLFTKVKIDTKYKLSTSHTPYCWINLPLRWSLCLSVCRSLWSRTAAGRQRVSVSGPLWRPPLPLTAAGWGERSSSAGSPRSHLPAWPRQSVQSPQKGTMHYTHGHLCTQGVGECPNVREKNAEVPSWMPLW